MSYYYGGWNWPKKGGNRGKKSVTCQECGAHNHQNGLRKSEGKCYWCQAFIQEVAAKADGGKPKELTSDSILAFLRDHPELGTLQPATKPASAAPAAWASTKARVEEDSDKAAANVRRAEKAYQAAVAKRKGAEQYLTEMEERVMEAADLYADAQDAQAKELARLNSAVVPTPPPSKPKSTLRLEDLLCDNLDEVLDIDLGELDHLSAEEGFTKEDLEAIATAKKKASKDAAHYFKEQFGNFHEIAKTIKSTRQEVVDRIRKKRRTDDGVEEAKDDVPMAAAAAADLSSPPAPVVAPSSSAVGLPDGDKLDENTALAAQLFEKAKATRSEREARRQLGEAKVEAKEPVAQPQAKAKSAPPRRGREFRYPQQDGR